MKLADQDQAAIERLRLAAETDKATFVTVARIDLWMVLGLVEEKRADVVGLHPPARPLVDAMAAASCVEALGRAVERVDLNRS